MNKNKLLKITALSGISLGVLGTALTFFTSAPANSDDYASASQYHIMLAFYTAAFVFDVVASGMFIAGLRGFSVNLKRAYLLLCSGITILGLSYMQLPLLAAADRAESLWRSNGFIVIPFLVSTVVLFSGTRKYAKLVGAKHYSLSYWFAALSALTISTLAMVIPHPQGIDQPQSAVAANVIVLWCACWIALAGYNALLIKRSSGVIYIEALAWLNIGMFLTAASGFLYCAIIFVAPQAGTAVAYIASVPTLPLASLCFLRSAYSFNRIGANADTSEHDSPRNFFGKPFITQADRKTTSVDVVMYAANLVSDPHAIDPMLDRLRTMTALFEPNHTPTASEENQLMRIYLEIEAYIATGEPIRKLTAQELRSDISQKVRPAIGDQTFWDRLPADTLTDPGNPDVPAGVQTIPTPPDYPHA